MAKRKKAVDNGPIEKNLFKAADKLRKNIDAAEYKHVVLFNRVKKNTTIDWLVKENVRAKLRVIIKRTLRQFGYPPEMSKLATETVLKQAEDLAIELSAVA